MRDEELVALVSTPEVHTLEGAMIPRHSGVLPGLATALHRFVAARQPREVLEVGLGQGVSSVAILTALEHGRLTSIDPIQTRSWKGAGVAEIASLGLADRHRFIEDYDYFALPQLLRAGEHFDLAYLDGWHTFDYTLLDLFYADKLLDVGGVLVVNDCGWAAVDAAVRAFLAHREYVELPVNPPAYQAAYRGNGRVLPYGVGRLLRYVPDSKRGIVAKVLKGRIVRGEDRYFEKRSTTEPRWDHFTFF